MIRTTLNLARQPGENLRRVRILWGGSLVLLLVALVVLSAIAATGWLGSRPIQRQVAAVRAQIGTLQAAHAADADPATNPAVRSELQQAAFFNQLIERKSVSWTLLFERLEQIQPPGVELISLRPVERNGQQAIDIRFASETLAPAVTFVQQIEQSADFADARVEHETEADPSQAGGPAGSAPQPRFQIELTALYRGTP